VTNGSSGSKLASLTADRIIKDIARLGWPEGDVVGSEQDLLDRYGVSRAVFREAVRLLEHLHVARMRRGPGGGLIVMSPTIDAVTDAVSVYLYSVGASIDEVFEARVLLEELATDLASQRLTDSGAERLKLELDSETEPKSDHRAVHNAIGTLSQNPALSFVVELFNRVTLLYLPRGSRLEGTTLGASHDAHVAIVRAVVAGDSETARRRMRKHLMAEAEFLRSRRPSVRRLRNLPEIASRSHKRAEQVAAQVFFDIASEGREVGELLGSEAELIERYDVSRAVWREAVRVLEHHQIAKMRRGPGGGFFVAQPGVEAVTDAVALQVDRFGIEPKHLFEIRSAVEMEVLERVFRQPRRVVRERLESALESERTATPDEFGMIGHDLHFVLADLAGNRALALLTAVLLRLTRLHQAQPADVKAPFAPETTMSVHRLIVDAVVAGDDQAARRRMKKHLDALTRWSR
jgi:DNA-binding FadR family transcriptional regulator